MFLVADATRLPFADNTFDLVFGSPPYMDARTYGIKAKRKCQVWVEWMMTVTSEAVRVSKGLVIWVCAGVTRGWNYQPGCEGLLYEWWKAGGRCWRPAYWHRDGIPGSGGPQWLRANIEYCLCFTKCRKSVPWADNTANGNPPKYKPGGAMSNRLANGSRVPAGKTVDGVVIHKESYTPPKLANPGSLVKGIRVGGGMKGHKAAHDNEAPFPQPLPEWFIRGWCPPGGIVYDPFSGSGTTVAAAMTLRRRGVGGDLRFSQCVLGRDRCGIVQPTLFE